MSLSSRLPTTPIPLKLYVDDMFVAKEREALKNLPSYLGTSFLTPHIGDYSVIPSTFQHYALVHDKSGIYARRDG